MTIQVHVLNAGGRLPEFDLRAAAEVACKRAGALLDLHAVDVVVYENRWGVIALSADELIDTWAQAHQSLDAPTYDHAAWFYGTGSLPRHAGYALGWAKVSGPLTDRGLDAADAWALPATELVR